MVIKFWSEPYETNSWLKRIVTYLSNFTVPDLRPGVFLPLQVARLVLLLVIITCSLAPHKALLVEYAPHCVGSSID